MSSNNFKNSEFDSLIDEDFLDKQKQMQKDKEQKEIRDNEYIPFGKPKRAKQPKKYQIVGVQFQEEEKVRSEDEKDKEGDDEFFGKSSLKKPRYDKKQKSKTAFPTKQEEEEPWRDKPSEFFVMGHLEESDPADEFNPWRMALNDAQWAFVYQYYEDYVPAPYEIMSWIYEKALENDQKMLEKNLKDEDFRENKYSQIGLKQKNQKQNKKKQQITKKSEIKVQEIKAKKIEKQIKKMGFKEKQVEYNPFSMKVHTKKHFTIAVVGPQNSGKSTLCGQILSQLQSSENGKQKNIWSEEEKIGLSSVMDFLDQEQYLQKTIESGLANFQSDEYRYSIFDTPGDPQYFQNMMSVAALSDLVIYVVSAKTIDYEKEYSKTPANTLEQLSLLYNMGVTNLIVAVNKMDTVGWKEYTFSQVKTKISPLLLKTGFSLDNVSWIPISGQKGECIDKSTCGWFFELYMWYKEMCLIQNLDLQVSQIAAQRDAAQDGEALATIFNVYQYQTDFHVYCKIEKGEIKISQTLTLLPQNQPVQVLMITDESQDRIETAQTGDCVRLDINIADGIRIHSGNILSSVSAPCESIFTILVLLSKNCKLISCGFKCMLHLNTCLTECLVLSISRQSGGKRLQFAKQNETVILKIKTEEPLPAVRAYDGSKFSMVSLRDGGKTVGVGHVVTIGK